MLIGGSKNHGVATNETYFFNNEFAKNGFWQPGPTLMAPRLGHTAGFIIADKGTPMEVHGIVVVGGRTEDHFHKSVEILWHGSSVSKWESGKVINPRCMQP